MKRVVMILLLSIFCMSNVLYAGNGDLTVSGSLEMTSTTKGFLPPQMDTTARNLISSPTAGLLIYNTTENAYNLYTGSSWMTLPVADSGGKISGGWLPFQGLRDTARGLRISVNTSENKVVVNAAEVILQDSNGYAKIFTVSNKTGDLTISGAGGRDTGPEQGSVWYYIWLIGKNDGTASALLSQSSTSPAMPSGYTYKGLFGAVYSDPSAALLPFEQIDNRVVWKFNNGIMLGGFTTSAWTQVPSINLNRQFPLTAKVWKVRAGSQGNQMLFAPLYGGYGAHVFRPGVSSTYQAAATSVGGFVFQTARIYWDSFEIPNMDGNLYYYVVNANTDLYAVGWEY